MSTGINKILCKSTPTASFVKELSLSASVENIQDAATEIFTYTPSSNGVCIFDLEWYMNTFYQTEAAVADLETYNLECRSTASVILCEKRISDDATIREYQLYLNTQFYPSYDVSPAAAEESSISGSASITLGVDTSNYYTVEYSMSEPVSNNSFAAEASYLHNFLRIYKLES